MELIYNLWYCINISSSKTNNFVRIINIVIVVLFISAGLQCTHCVGIRLNSFLL
jgi:hypothetical protein